MWQQLCGSTKATHDVDDGVKKTKRPKKFWCHERGMKSLQDVVDGFKRLAKHEKQNMKIYVKIVRVTNIVDHMI